MLRDEQIEASGDASVFGAGELAGTDHGARCDQLHRRLLRIVKARGLLDVQEADALREAQKLGLWRRYGYTSLVDYMEKEMGYSPRTALERLRVANALPQLPQIAAAMESGTLTFSGAKELTRVATPETEAVWIGATRDLNVREVEQAVAGHRPGELPTDPPDPRLQTMFLRYEVSEGVHAMMRQTQQLLEKERGERLDDSAFLEALCRAVLDGHRGTAAPSDDDGHRGTAAPSDDDGHRGTAPPSDDAREGALVLAETSDCDHAIGANSRDSAAYQVAVTLCRQCRRGWQDGAGVVVELTPAEIDRAVCDAQFVGDLDSPTVERARQAIPPAMRRKVKRRDHGTCRVPGCRGSKNIDIHHITPVADGGTNSLENLVTLCEAHHLALHSGTLRIERQGCDLAFHYEGRNAFTRATRAVDAARLLRDKGYERDNVRQAIEKTRAHVGTTDLTTEHWVQIAEHYLREAS